MSTVTAALFLNRCTSCSWVVCSECPVVSSLVYLLCWSVEYVGVKKYFIVILGPSVAHCLEW